MKKIENRPSKETFRITKSDVRAAIKTLNPERTLKSGLQTVINAIDSTLRWNGTTVDNTKSGVKYIYHYSFINPTSNISQDFDAVLYPSGKISIANQPVVIGDTVAQLARFFRLSEIAA